MDKEVTISFPLNFYKILVISRIIQNRVLRFEIRNLQLNL